MLPTTCPPGYAPDADLQRRRRRDAAATACLATRPTAVDVSRLPPCSTLPRRLDATDIHRRPMPCSSPCAPLPPAGPAQPPQVLVVDGSVGLTGSLNMVEPGLQQAVTTGSAASGWSR